jgi:hypothetical protein
LTRLVVLALLSAFVLAGFARATPRPETTRFSAELTPNLVVPRPIALTGVASGRFRGLLDVPSNGVIWPHRFYYRLRFSGLTGPPTSITIRTGRRGQAGSPWLGLCVRRCPTSRSGIVRGWVWVEASEVKRAFERHGFYVQIDTARNQDGELRGQLKPVR